MIFIERFQELKQVRTMLTVFSLLMVLLNGCGSGKLSEDKARDMLNAVYPKEIAGFIDLTYQADAFTLNRTKVKENQTYLEEAGLIYQNGGSGRFIDAFRSGFTDLARSFMIGKPKSMGAYSDKVKAEFRIGELRFSEVTGIFQEETPGVAEVEYSLQFVSNGFPVKCSTNEYGELSDGDTVRLKTRFKKYDSGWRIEN